jgi:hypothetical protein
MKNIVLISFFSLSLLTISCKKDPDPAPVVTPPADKYMTFTTASSWNFERISDPSSLSPDTISFSITSSNRDTTIGTRQYHVFANNNGGSNEYYYNNGGDYFTFRQLPSDFADTYVEINYLKDNAPVGTEWSQTYPITYSGFPITLTLKNKIEERGITKTVNGKEYTDVIRVSTNITATAPFPFSLTDEINFYYAPRYGSIKEETKIDVSVPLAGISSKFEETKSLLSADLK